MINVIQTLKERCINLNDELLANRDLVRILQNSIVTCKNQIGVLQRFQDVKSAKSSTEQQESQAAVDEAAVQFLLEAESSRTALELENAQLKRELGEAKDRIM